MVREKGNLKVIVASEFMRNQGMITQTYEAKISELEKTVQEQKEKIEDLNNQISQLCNDQCRESHFVYEKSTQILFDISSVTRQLYTAFQTAWQYLKYSSYLESKLNNVIVEVKGLKKKLQKVQVSTIKNSKLA
tara:strand:- start:1547 stop:1948 length:402 start_codon:yes stop_codon:yes gene_type:complete